MNTYRLTNHAEARLRQRGMLEYDLELVTSYGTLQGNIIFMKDRDVQVAVTALKRKIQRLERLKGRTLVIGTDRVITVYKADRKRQKQILRGTH